MRKLHLAIAGSFLLLGALCGPAVATTYYLDGSVSSSGSGQSWATAWKSFSNINGLKPGDIVLISGGTTGQTYNTGEFDSASGTNGNPITYKAATDAGHGGAITISSSSGNQFIYANPSSNIGQWIVFDGNVGGISNITIQGWNTAVYGDGTVGMTFRYVKIKGTLRFGDPAHAIELDHVTLDLPSGSDHAVFGITCGGTSSYRTNLVHDSKFMLRYMRGNGWGDDGFQWPGCTSFYNNQWLGVYDANYPGNQHQDGIQTGSPYVAVYNNYFQNMQNYPIYGDSLNGNTIQHYRIYNNVMYQPDTTGSQAVSIGCDGVACMQTDIIVGNNTVVSSDHCIFINQGTSGTLTNSYVYNNLCYGSDILVGSSSTSNNLTSTSGVTFVNPTSDWHLQSSSTAAIGKATSPSVLTSVYTTDKDANQRPTGSWDIGAYQLSSSISVVAPPTALSALVQ